MTPCDNCLAEVPYTIKVSKIIIRLEHGTMRNDTHHIRNDFICKECLDEIVTMISDKVQVELDQLLEN